jgi:HEAT repeat protein
VISSMEMDRTEQARELLEMLTGDDLDNRLTAIQVVGTIGGEEALKILRERLALVNEEIAALIVTVEKLKRKLGENEKR